MEGEPGVVDSILATHPAIVLAAKPGRVDFVTMLHTKGIIDARDRVRLELFLQENYVVKSIGESEYFVVKDRAGFVQPLGTPARPKDTVH